MEYIKTSRPLLCFSYHNRKLKKWKKFLRKFYEQSSISVIIKDGGFPDLLFNCVDIISITIETTDDIKIPMTNHTHFISRLTINVPCNTVKLSKKLIDLNRGIISIQTPSQNYSSLTGMSLSGYYSINAYKSTSEYPHTY